MLTVLTLKVIGAHMNPTHPFSLRALPRPQRVAWLAAFALMAAGLAHLAGFYLAEGASWSGPTGFRKPMVFGISGGLTLLSLGWILGKLEGRPRAAMAISVVASGTLLLEVAIISLQRWRGQPSHFNVGTLFDATLWSAMGAAILVLAASVVALAILSFGRIALAPAARTAVRASLVLLCAGQVSGQIIVFHGASIVMQDGVFHPEAIARAATVGEGGDLKLPHALALHAVQAIPLLGLMFSSLSLPTARARRWVLLSAGGYGAVFATTQAMALAGLPVGAADAWAAIGLFGGAAAFATPFAWAIVLAFREAERRNALSPQPAKA